jgi:hypothetical protein
MISINHREFYVTDRGAYQQAWCHACRSTVPATIKLFEEFICEQCLLNVITDLHASHAALKKQVKVPVNRT